MEVEVAHTANRTPTRSHNKAMVAMRGHNPTVVTNSLRSNRPMDNPTTNSSNLRMVVAATNKQRTEVHLPMEACLHNLNSQPMEVMLRHHQDLRRLQVPGRAHKRRMVRPIITTKKQAKLSGTSLQACPKLRGQNACRDLQGGQKEGVSFSGVVVVAVLFGVTF